MTSVTPQDTETNIPVRNLWHMLLYAWRKFHASTERLAGSETAPDIMILLTRVLIVSTTQLLKRQLRREYNVNRSPLMRIRGKIILSETFKYRSIGKRSVVCEYDQVDINVLKNQIIKTVLEGQKAIVETHINMPYNETTVNQLKLMKNNISVLVNKMSGVDTIDLSHSHFSKITIDRNDGGYALPLEICRLIFRLNIPQEISGRRTLSDLRYRSHVIEQLPDIFETFVRNFTIYQLKATHDVKKEILYWRDINRNPYTPTMQTDVSVTNRTTNQKLIVDTKFYGATLQRNRDYDSKKFISTHLYQMYAYLRTQEENDRTHENTKGLILYPYVDTHLNEEILVQNYSIKLSTLDLRDPWLQIEARLTDLINP